MKRIATTLAVSALLWASNSVAGPPERVTFGPMAIEGIPVANCAGFDVLLDWNYYGEYFVYFGKDGYPERIFYKQRYPAVYYNSVNRDIRVYSNKSSGDQRWIELEDGQEVLNSAQVHTILTVPGYGLIEQDVGRVELDLRTFEITFRAHDYRLDSDALCAALSP